MELEKSGVDFRAIHEERRRMIGHLEELLHIMQKRDLEIERLIVVCLTRYLGDQYLLADMHYSMVFS